MYESKRWTAERWQTMTGRIQSAVWSPCGSILLFVTVEETVLYALSFKTGSAIFTRDSNASPQVAVPVLDLSKIELPNQNVTGGLVQALEWDPKGRHLAILFRDTNYITIFTTTVCPALQLSPWYVMKNRVVRVLTTFFIFQLFDIWLPGRNA